MLSRLIDPADGLPRERVFWLVVAALASGLLLAFYLLCSHQVRKAQAQRAEAQVARLAANDCLQYLANSTIASCAPASFALAAGRTQPAAGGRAGAAPAAVSWR